MTGMGLAASTGSTKSFSVMGKTFDPAKPEEYLQSFAIKRV
jgi:nitrate/nitrite transport system substrate-binding protein